MFCFIETHILPDGSSRVLQFLLHQSKLIRNNEVQWNLDQED